VAPYGEDSDDRIAILESAEQVRQACYEWVIEQGGSETTATLAADMVTKEYPGRIRQLARMFEEIEKLIQKREPETLSLRWRLFMWNYKDEDATTRIDEMRGAGMPDSEIASHVFPLWWDLIRRGRRHVNDYIAYANQMAEIAEVVHLASVTSAEAVPEEVRTAPARGRRKGTGTFRTPREFRMAMASAFTQLRLNSKRLTVENVAEFFSASSDSAHPKCDGRQLRQWFRDQFGYPTWEDVIDDVGRDMTRAE
jgi:hypothetical protein